jgi:hypothetical protein
MAHKVAKGQEHSDWVDSVGRLPANSSVFPKSSWFTSADQVLEVRVLKAVSTVAVLPELGMATRAPVAVQQI